jgi:hypothetical protein
MKSHFTIALAIVALMTSCSSDKYSPDKYFTKDQQNSILKQSVRYSAKLPPQASHKTKFSSEFDKYYHLAFKESDFRKCFPVDGSSKNYYFLTTREARSIWPAREAIGGKFTLNDKDSVIGYEEAFRTWKMAKDSLDVRANELFDRMVKGEDLIPFTSKFKGDRYIEFPDERFYFNKDEMRWRDKAFDTLKLQ